MIEREKGIFMKCAYNWIEWAEIFKKSPVLCSCIDLTVSTRTQEIKCRIICSLRFLEGKGLAFTFQWALGNCSKIIRKSFISVKKSSVVIRPEWPWILHCESLLLNRPLGLDSIDLERQWERMGHRTGIVTSQKLFSVSNAAVLQIFYVLSKWMKHLAINLSKCCFSLSYRTQ